MKLEKIVGLFIIALSIITLSLQISISNLAKYIDQTTGEFWSTGYEYNYIPSIIYWLFLAALGIGLYLTLRKEKSTK
ncbi:hypothetical protein [Paramaledivibacter caminithermalis]|jgi:hypothetical protein|uniref:Uncharacterized protein n=1 Tax=Paramaledivibacter caminithermalis (strain DSM 15212 / CIP 107654 / DViRD3) TaxID=1121301 RepID=A0A1M6SEI4_PARC5|nr:hypothetical protein [Paramaledivibacter caminithermalis]SHK43120.1 hypothetical protein SAMN02745912_03286 [Paramaledivibacter caminithermalis DSM 15212]